MLCLSVAVVFGLQAVTPNKAHALAAAGMAIASTGGAATIAIIGAGMWGGSFVSILFQGLTYPNSQGFEGLFAILFIVGAYMLPDQSGGVELTAIQPGNADFNNIPYANIQQYNNELPVINLARQEITASLMSGEIKSAKVMRAKWLSYRNSGAISAEAFSVLEKVSDITAKQVAKSL